MIVKRYSGRTAEEALAQAKWELGDDAVILSSGKNRDRWWKFWQTGFQVLVATDYPVAKSAGNRKSPKSEEPSDRVVPLARPKKGPQAEGIDHTPVLDRIEIREMPEERRAVAADTGPVQPASPGSDTETLLRTLYQIDDRLGRLEGFAHGTQQKAYQFLTDRGLDSGIARNLAEQVTAKGKTWKEELAAAVARQMPKAATLASGGKQLVVVVVGPTGSGKTTTIAKLAAHYHLEQQKSVLMVTTDTFRVGAVEQVETFAGILKVPFRVANRPKDVKDLVQSSDADVVLIDTQGHSVRHSLHMAEIRSVWEGTRTAEVLLTVPATFAGDEIRNLVTGFLHGEPGKLVVTKVDEAHRPGPLVSALMTMSLPVCFVTNGQSVPEDIQVAKIDGLVQWLMEGEYRG